MGALDDAAVGIGMKSLPAAAEPLRLGEVAARGWNVLREDLPLPLALLRESALAHNSRWMRRFLALTGSYIVPHGKTTMSPQLFHRQLEDGALGITVATVGQLRVCREHGIDRVVLANQLVGARDIDYVLDELHRDPDFDFYALVDSVAGVERLARAARAHPLRRPLQLLLEGGFAGGRTGCRSVDEALAVAEAIGAAGPALALRGVEGFEGLIAREDDRATEAAVDRFLDFLLDVAAQCDARGLFAPGPVVLSAGGSSFYDMVAARLVTAGLGREVQVWLRCGCYLTHDSGMYARHFARLAQRLAERFPELEGEAAALDEDLRPALELWAYVQSRPEPGLAILTMGKRDCSFDAGLPRPQAWFRPGVHGAPSPFAHDAEITALNDQHAYLRIAADSPLRVGDMVASGISHPCTTFDRWQLLMVVDDDYDVVGAVRTFFG